MLPLRSDAWRICELRSCSAADRVASLRDAHRARMWVLAFKADASRMGGMRRLLSSNGYLHVFRLSNDDVVDAIADLLARGRLHVHTGPVRTVVAAAAASAPAESAPVPFPLAPRQAPTSTPRSRAAPPSDPPSFSPDADLDQQAGTLVAAAEQGVPFCAMCANG